MEGHVSSRVWDSREECRSGGYQECKTALVLRPMAVPFPGIGMVADYLRHRRVRVAATPTGRRQSSMGTTRMGDPARIHSFANMGVTHRR